MVTSLNITMGAFLTSLGLEQLKEVFDREQVSNSVIVFVLSNIVSFCQLSQGIDWNYTLSMLLFSQGIDSPRYTLG